MKERLINYIKTDEKLKGALIGISVLSAKTGEGIFQYNGDIRMHPASNMKLLTSVAALDALGEDYTFQTEIHTDGVIVKGKLKGNLYLIGKGDPTLLPCTFDKLAAQLDQQGITEIEGDIIGDDTWYDDVKFSQDLTWTDEQYYYGAPVSSLTASPNEDYDTASVIVKILPGRSPFDKPKVQIHPELHHITVINQAITVKEDVEDELIVERKHAANEFKISGRISINSEAVIELMSIWDATEYALQLFKSSIQKSKIIFHGALKTGKKPKQSKQLLIHHSIPLYELIIPFMKWSNNGHAEILVKEMGKVVYGKGNWENGLEVMKEEVSKYDVNLNHCIMKDGSGISHSNAIPPNEIVKLLYQIQERPWFPIFLNALPLAGIEERMIGGTLRDRLAGFQVRAKTGTIEGVSTLSGYMYTKKGRRIVFSIMINHLIDEEEGKIIEDEIIAILHECNQ